MLKLLFYVILLLFTSTNLFCQKNKLIKSYYNNNTLFSEGYKKDGLMQGEWHYYYSSGSLKSIEYYDKGKLSGKYYEYYENGKVKTIGNYNSNYTISVSKKDTLDDGQITDVVIEYSCRIGIWRYYKNDGTCVKKEFKNCK